MYLISAVTFIQWFRRAYANLHTVSNNLMYSEGWAAGAWFIPILNLFRPFQIMKDLYLKTNSYLSSKVEGFKKVPNDGLINSWWALWIIGNFLGNAVLRLSMRAEDIDDFLQLTNLSMISAGLGIPTALFIIKLIKDYSKLETLMFKIDSGEEIGFYHPQTNFNLNDDILDQDVF